MPRNASGIYTLPEAAFVAGTVIRSAPVNSDLSDIATALTQSLATTGVTVMTGPIKAANGTVTAPSYTFANSLGTGFYRISDNEMGYAVNGVNKITFHDDGNVEYAGAIRFGNADVADVNYLDWYEQGTFTPVLSFGGTTTGITYAVQLARFTRIGNIVYFSIEITLTSNGSGTGNAIVAGLPYAASNTNAIDYAVEFIFFTGFASGSEYFFGEITNGESQVRLFRFDNAGTTSVALDETNIQDTCDFTITGFYFA